MKSVMPGKDISDEDVYIAKPEGGHVPVGTKPTPDEEDEEDDEDEL
jgi:hypothetical protein